MAVGINLSLTCLLSCQYNNKYYYYYPSLVYVILSLIMVVMLILIAMGIIYFLCKHAYKKKERPAAELVRIK